MTMLVTLDEAKEELRIDHDADDARLERHIRGASAAVLAYIGDSQYLFLDTGGDEIDLQDTSANLEGERAKDLARTAVFLMLHETFDGKEAKQVEPAFGYGYLSRPVVSILYPLRSPTVA